GVLRALRRKTPARGDGLFRSLIGGMEELVTALEHRLPLDSIQRGTPIQAIAPDESGGWRLTADGANTRARAVLLACPAHVAASLLRPIDSRCADLCSEVPYVSTASVALAWPRRAIAHPLNGSGFVVARQANRLRITACTWVSSKWSGRAPAGMALLRAFVGGSHDPSAVDLPDEEIVRLASSE